MKAMHVILAACVLAGCDLKTSPEESASFGNSFDQGTAGWTADFTDFPVGDEEMMELGSAHETLPAPLGSRSGFKLTGVNTSDDLFMYIRTYIDGVRPNTRYSASFTVSFATDAPAGCVGVGGAPGESVVIKAGVSQQVPAPFERDGDWRLSVDKGEQLEEGAAALVLGNVATTNTDCASRVWQMKTLDSGGRTVLLQSDVQGGFWLFTGVESGFEGRTTIYFTDVDVKLARVF